MFVHNLNLKLCVLVTGGYSDCQQQRLIWVLGDGMKLLPDQPGRLDPNKLSRDVITSHIHHLVPH